MSLFYTRMRLASLSPAITEILFALGCEKQIMCVDKFSDEPDGARAIAHLKDHQALTIEAITPYTPDIVFTATLTQDRLQRELSESDQFKVIHFDPRSVADVLEMIKTIGLLLDVSVKAREVAEKMRVGFASIEKKAKFLPRRPRVYIEEWHSPPMVSGNWVPELIKIAGGESLLLPAGSASREVTLQEIQQFDPDIIVLSICGAGNLATKKLLTERAGWAELRAVLSNALHIIDDSLLNRPGPRLVEGAQRLYGWLFEATH